LAKKYTFEEIYDLFKEHGCKLVSKTYESSKKPLDFICSCGKPDTKRLEVFKRRGKCRDCCYFEAQEDKRLTLDQAKEVFAKNGCTLLASEYKNNKTRMKYICKCGRQDFSSVDAMNDGQHCYECRNKKISDIASKYTIDDVREIFASRGCVLLSTEYHKVHDYLDYICSCGERDTKRFGAFLYYEQSCYTCGLLKNSGENHSRWNPELTEEEREDRRYNKKNIEWRQSIFTRDDYTCQSCNNRGVAINAHHLNAWHWCIEQRYDISNGVTLCDYCHNIQYEGSFHNIYGNKNNTREQYEEWLRNKQKQDAM
jgi:hypothetical protein